MNKYATSYKAIISGDYMNRNEIQEDCGRGIHVLVEQATIENVKIRRELFHAKLGSIGGVYLGNRKHSDEKLDQIGYMQNTGLDNDLTNLSLGARHLDEHITRITDPTNPYYNGNLSTNSKRVFLEGRDGFLNTSFSSDHNYLSGKVVGALAIKQGKNTLLVCVGPLDVEDEICPNDGHFNQVFSGNHYIIFEHDPKVTKGKMFKRGLDPMDPRSWNLSTGLPFNKEKLGPYGYLMQPIPLEELVKDRKLLHS
jgi:hypothetical protein